jgi:thiol-disulfide isomerase/thioredoxin
MTMMSIMKAQRVTATLLFVLLTAGSVGAFAPSPLALVRPQHQHPHQHPLSMALETDLSSSSLNSTSTTSTTTEAQFGDVVSRSSSSGAMNMNMNSNTNAADSTVQFGDTVRRTDRPSPSATAVASVTTSNNDNDSMTDAVETAANIQRRNIVTAALSIALAVLNYAWQLSHPVTPIQLLFSMQGASESITVVGSNTKPTVVDFWAPWCENCKLSAPTLRQVEEEYKDRVNFVMIDGDKEAAWPYIEAFGVDAIPHLALVSAKGDVETALIGPIPKHVLEADLDVLIRNAAAEQPSGKELPYTMLDTFANKPPEQRRLHFDH